MQGFEAIKHLLGHSTGYRFVLGCRDVKRTEQAFNEVDYNKTKHSFDFLPLELSDLKNVRSFAQQVLKQTDKIDYLVLNAALTKAANEDGINGSNWCETYLVNHLCKSSPCMHALC